MPPKESPKLYALDDQPANTTFSPDKYEQHPDGGDTPANPSNRGDITLPCPRCGEVLVRNVSAEYLRISVFRCRNCHKVSSGRAEDLVTYDH